MATPQVFIINQAKISEQVYEYLHGEITSGRLAPGQRLDLEALVEQRKISKMPIKEAIGCLASEGLLDIQSRRITYVGCVDPRDLAETFEVRRALELLAGELAAQGVTKAEINKLRDLIAQMEASQDVGPQLELNFQFHGLIVELSGNRKLIEMYHRLRVPIQVAGIHYRSEVWRAHCAGAKRTSRHRARARTKRC